MAEIQHTVRNTLPTRKYRRLTVPQIKGLVSRSERYEVGDPDMAGLQLRVDAKLAGGAAGAKSWQWRFQWKGKRQKMAIGQWPELSQADAHERVRKARALLERGIDPRQGGLKRERSLPTPDPNSDGRPVEPHSIEHLANEFFKRHIRPRLKRPEQVERLINVEVVKHWRTRDARTIMPRDVITLLNAIVDRGSRTVANDLGAYLSQMFRFGIQQDIVETNPVQLLFPPGGEEKSRTRVLSDDELNTLLHNLDDVFIRAPTTAIAIRIALLTAYRRSELVLARWTDLKLDIAEPMWSVPIENSKTDIEYLIPLVPAAVVEFKRLKARAGRSRFVMPNESGDGPLEPRLMTRSIARHMTTLKKKHGIAKFTHRDLRRTVRTGLARVKVLPHIADRVLNHKQPGVDAVYDRFEYADEKRAALDKWAHHISALSVKL
jgi:integrase